MGQIITVDFHRDTLFAVQRDDGVYVAIKPICDGLGIDWKAQRNRIDRNPVLYEGRVVMTLPSVGGPQETVCLRLDLLNGWLFGIDVERVREDRKARVLEYQRECYRVLFEHFYGRTHSSAEPASVEPAGNEAHKLRMVAEARLTFGYKAAQWLWINLGLKVGPPMLEPGAQPDLFDPDAGPPAPAEAA